MSYLPSLPETRTELEERLLFRRQFVMGPHFIDAFPSWRRLHIGSSFRITAHQDLNVYQAVSGRKSVTLLGYILDPRDHDASDADIVDGLLRALVPEADFGDFIRLTDPLGGRWVLIVDDGQRVRLFTDPCGYRQVFYTNTSMRDVLWCGSQPGIIAETMHLKTDGEAMSLIQTYEGKREGGYQGIEYFWPGDRSPYREIKRLIPNHYLDLRTGVSHRFWPRTASVRLSVDDAIDTNALLLRDLINCASQRFPLALTMTAGRDTRLLLAACRDLRDQVFFFTLTSYFDVTDDSADVQIPAALLSRLGLTHHLIRCPSEMSPEFASIYRRNVTPARMGLGPLAEALHTAYPQDRVCMKGNAIPIARARFVLEGMSRREATAAGLAKRFAAEGHPFAIRAFEDWLTNAKQVSNVALMDLFYWENIEGSWQAMSQLEWDIALEVFVPYNCRTLLANSLAVDEKYRRPPRYYFFEKLMARLWPDVLSVPINPHDPHQERKTMRSHVRNLLIKTHLYGFVPDRLKGRRKSY